MTLSNYVTLSRILLSAALVLCLRRTTLSGSLAALALFILASLTDYWDGLVARRRGEVTALGAFLDPLADKCLVLAALWSFVVMHLVPVWMVAVITAREVLVTVARTAVLSRRSVAAIWSGKYKAFAQMMTIGLILGALILDRGLWPAMTGRLLQQPVMSATVWLLMAWTTAITVVSGLHLAMQWQTAEVSAQAGDQPLAPAAVFVATLGGIGFVPLAPGLAGSLMGLGIAAAFHAYPALLLAMIVGACLVALWAVPRAVRTLGKDDPPAVVLDEVLGLLVAVAWLPWRWQVIAPAFVLFRVLDVTKPLGIRRLERWPGAWGILADDVVCGLLANGALQLAVWSGAV